ncbi:MAG: methyltransferase [Acidimicrobiales bacterium]|nr:methyltransferase [Acidimicrobiales bacterium]
MADDSVYRLFSEMGESDRVAVWPFVESQIQLGTVIESELMAVEDHVAPATSILRHPKLDLITFPFEWSFQMLKDAALLQLDLVRAGALAGVGVKDASSYNIQFVGTTPIFIDVGSFQPRKRSDPWFGYQQFCELFLYPLMLKAYAGVSFQPFLRGSVHGIPVDQAKGLLGPLRLKRQRGRFTHVLFHALAQAKLADSDEGVAEDVAESGMKTELLLATVAKTRKLVESMDTGLDESLWSDYSDRGHYESRSLAEKAAFVDDSLAGAGALGHVWDVGCNDGMFSRIAANHADVVLAMDADELVIDQLYKQLRTETSVEANRITPLVVDLSTAGGGVGWRGSERPGLFHRSRPDAVIYLAVIHHLALTFNIPLQQQLDLLADSTENLVIEFPDENDQMVQKLLRNKRPGIYSHYTLDNFERLLGERFEVRRRETLTGGSRTIFFATRTPRTAS